MKELRPTTQFRRDLKRAAKRGKDLHKLEAVLDRLARGEALAPRHRAHRLRGEMSGLCECHVEPDWLLVWDDTPDAIILVRCGTHADLFE